MSSGSNPLPHTLFNSSKVILPFRSPISIACRIISGTLTLLSLLGSPLYGE